MDKTLQCKECGKYFIYSDKEQAFFQRLLEEGKIKTLATPKRCLDCRKLKKERKAFE